MIIRKADRPVHHLRQIRPRNRLVSAHIRKYSRDNGVLHLINGALNDFSVWKGAIARLSVRYIDYRVLISIGDKQLLLRIPVDLSVS